MTGLFQFGGVLYDSVVRTIGDTIVDQQLAPPTVTYDDVVAYASTIPDRPRPGSVEVGALVHDRLRGLSTPSLRQLDPLNALLGVPVVTPDGMDPRTWRLLDTDGHVIKEGTL